jgi:hypothetical protein
VSPILIRPVREQLEHDRLIRYLANKYKKKHEVSLNVGDDQIAPVKIGPLTLYPDVVWTDGKRLAGLAEVETSESVNNLEAMAQWVHFSRAKVPFHLYVPVQGYDASRRLCEANQAKVSEIWTYRASMDGFDLVRAYADASAPVSPPAAVKKQVVQTVRSATTKPVSKPAAKKSPAKPAKPAAKPAKPAKPARSARPAARSAKAVTRRVKKVVPRKAAAKLSGKKAVSVKKKAGARRSR